MSTTSVAGSIRVDMYYLDERVAGRDAASARPAKGGARGDTIPFPVDVHNGRLRKGLPDLPQQLESLGFALAEMTSEEQSIVCQVDPFKMENDKGARAQYYRGLESVVQRATGATYVRAYNFVLRDSSIAGVHTRAFDDNTARGPVNGVHCDFTPDAPGIGQIRELATRLGLGGVRFAIVNCWRNTKVEPVAQWPMAVCDASSVDQERDLIEQRSPENGNMIYSVLPSENHRWYTFPAMTSSEVLLFKQYDSDAAVPRFTPHTAFDVPGTPEDAPVRASCEVRAVCFFAEDRSSDEALRRLHGQHHGLVAPGIVATWPSSKL